jgi:hypothetical protein
MKNWAIESKTLFKMPSSSGPIKGNHFLLSAFYDHYSFQFIFRGANSVLWHFKAICHLQYCVEAFILLPVLSGLAKKISNRAPKKKACFGFFPEPTFEKTFKTFF